MLKLAASLFRQNVSVSLTLFKKPMRSMQPIALHCWLAQAICFILVLCTLATTVPAFAQPTLDGARKAVRKNPKNPIAHYNLGIALADADQPEQAIEAFEQAIRLNPKFAEAYYSLGMMHDALEDYAAAVRALQEALRLNPLLPDLQFNLGLVLSKAGRHVEAVKVLRSIKADKAPLNYFYTIGTVALKSDSTTQDAIAAFEQIVRLAPDSLSFYQFLGDAYRKAKRYDDAVRTYEQILAKDPNNEDAIYALGITYVLSRQRAAAFKQHEKLERLRSALATPLINYIFQEMPKRQDTTRQN